MARLDFFFSVQLWGASSAIPVMRMLAEQAEHNVSRAVSDEMISSISDSGEFEEDDYDEDGRCTGTRLREWYSCGACVGYDDEVVSEYKFLITQLTRRSAYLTIFGIFENRMNACLMLMAELTGTVLKKRPSVELCHEYLTQKIGGAGIADVDHLTVIRNIMAHSDGIAEHYQEWLTSDVKLKDPQKRLIRALHRAQQPGAGISVTEYNNVNMDACFLNYAVDEFEHYTGKLEIAVRAYYEQSERLHATEGSA
ncbi:hypothetical protein LUL08_000834 [Escherichia coli]|nr:hypothetical protein [Escherichia coli]EJH1294982.1 hypothetical protein [Escherichia coli]EJH1410757.1 hypothetical protein [Escherichia coli]EJH1619715.1 hypothetical protein [Escherichia coli]